MSDKVIIMLINTYNVVTNEWVNSYLLNIDF